MLYRVWVSFWHSLWHLIIFSFGLGLQNASIPIDLIIPVDSILKDTYLIYLVVEPTPLKIITPCSINVEVQVEILSLNMDLGK